MTLDGDIGRLMAIVFTVSNHPTGHSQWSVCHLRRSTGLVLQLLLLGAKADEWRSRNARECRGLEELLSQPNIKTSVSWLR